MATLNRFTPEALEQHIREHMTALITPNGTGIYCCQLCELLRGEPNVD